MARKMYFRAAKVYPPRRVSKRVFRRIERTRSLTVAALLLIPVAAPCCVSPRAAAGAGGDADASIAAVRAQIDRMNAALLQVQTDLRAGRDVNTNDAWTLRLLGAGLLLLGLSYPVGKIVWLALLSLRGRYAKNASSSSECVDPLRDVRDFIAFKQRCSTTLAPK